MKYFPRLHVYPDGSKVQRNTGYIFRKTKRDGFVPEGRAVLMDYGEEFEEGDKAYHLDGDRTNNKKSNLVKIHFNTVKFAKMKESRTLYIPGYKPAETVARRK